MARDFTEIIDPLYQSIKQLGEEGKIETVA